MKDYSSSIDRDQLRRIQYGSTPEQRMNWLVEAGTFVMETRKNWKKRVSNGIWLPMLEHMRTDWMQEIRELEPALKEIRYLFVTEEPATALR